MQSLIKEHNLLSSFQHSSPINFPFYNDIFIFSGIFSLFLINDSLQNNSLNCLSISSKSSSSLLFSAFLKLVNIFWIFNFNSSLLLLIFSKMAFN